MEIFKTFRIEAAHRLPNVAPDHKCARLHGHSFRVDVHITGELDPELGWVMDFAALTDAFQPIFDKLDHRYLNEIVGLENPTSENIAKWIWENLVHELPGLSKIGVRETCTTGCIFSGPHSALAPSREAD